MEVLFFIIPVAVLVIFLLLKSRKKKASGKDAPEVNQGYYERLSVKGVPTKFEYEYRTPNGVKVLSVVKIVSEFQDYAFKAIEYGITNQLTATKAKFPQWMKKVNLSDYTVAFIEPHTTNGDGSPALMVHGLYQTAGTVIGAPGMNDGYPESTIVLPHQDGLGWKYLQYLMYAAWFESEHDREFSCDFEYAMSFAHSGDVHPHHALPDGVPTLTMEAGRGFSSGYAARCYFNPEK